MLKFLRGHILFNKYETKWHQGRQSLLKGVFIMQYETLRTYMYALYSPVMQRQLGQIGLNFIITSKI